MKNFSKLISGARRSGSNIFAKSSLFVCLIASLVLLNFQSLGQTTFSWRNDQFPANNASWLNTTPFYFWNGSTGAVPGGSEILFFDGIEGPTMTNNLTATNRFKITFGNSGSPISRTINGSTSNTFFEFGSTWPRIQNDATNILHTIGFPISASTNSGFNLELVANTGPLAFSNTINNNGRVIQIYGNNSAVDATNRYIQLSGVLSNTGALNVSQFGVVKLNATHTYTGQTQIDNGELWVESSGSIASGSGIFVGNGGLLTNVAKFWISNSTGGTTVSNAITINNGNTTTRYLGGLNSSGTHTFSGAITNNSTTGGLNLSALTSGGTTDFTGVISGSSAVITEGAGILKLSGSSANTYSGTTTANGTLLVLNKSADTKAIGGAMTIANGATVRTDANNQLGTGTPSLITINGTGVFNLNNTNQKIALASASSTASVTLGSGTLNIDNAGTDTYAGTISGTGGLTKTSAGTETFSGANSYTGTTTITGGVLQLGAAGVIANTSNIVMNGGTFSTGATAGFAETVGTLALSANSTIALGTGSHTLTFANSSAVSWTSGTILTITGWTGTNNGASSGTAGKIFVGSTSGTLTGVQLSRIRFSISAVLYGAMQLSTGEIVPSGGQVLYYGGATGTWTGSLWGTAEGGPYTTAWTSGRHAIFNIASANTLTMATTNVAAITYNENITYASGGTVSFGPAGAAVAPIYVESGKTFSMVGQGISVTAGNGIIKNGAGILQGANGNNYLGGFTINEGMFAIGGINAMGNGGALTINGGTLAGTANRDLTGKFTGITIGGDFTLGSSTSPASGTANLTFTNNTALGSSVTRTITLGGTGLYTWNGIISGTSSNLTLAATAAGTLFLGGVNTWGGATTINGGTLKPTVTGALPSTTALSFANTSGAILDLSTTAITHTIASLSGGGSTGGNISFGAPATAEILTVGDASNTTYSGLISGNGLITKVGTGTLTLGHTANTYTGTTTITLGELRLNPSTTTATFASPIKLNAGKLSTTSIAVNTVMTSSSTLELAISSVIDLGTAVHSLKFATSSGVAWAGTSLTINGWTGTAGASGTAGKIFFGAATGTLTPTQLGKITFTGYSGTPIILSTGELVPPVAAATYTWDGSTDGDWATAANWDLNAVPASTDNIVIPTSGSYTNALAITGTRTVNDFTVNGTGTYSMAASSSLTLNGNLTYSSSVAATYNCSSTLIIASSAAQTIPAADYGNLTVSGGARTLTSSATTRICGNYVPGSSTTVGTSIVEFNGTAAQAINTNAASFATLNITNTTATFTANVSVTVATAMTISSSAVYNNATGTTTWSSGSAININGTFRNSTAIDVVQTGATVTVGSAGTYDHNRNTAGALIVATWTAGSTCLITGTPNNPPSSGLGQSFSDFTWSGAMTGSFGFSGALLSIGRDFNVTTTGGFTLSLTTTQALPMNIGRDFNISGGFVTVDTGNNSNAIAVAITRDLNISGAGGLTILASGVTGTGTATVTVTGNTSITSSAGTALIINAASTKSATLTCNGTFTLNGSGTMSIAQSTNVAATGTLAANGAITLTAGTLNVASTSSSAVGVFSASSAMTVNGATLNISTLGNGTVNLTDNLVFSSGTITRTSGTSTFNFSKASGTQTVNQTSGTFSGIIGINAGTGATTNTVQLANDLNLGSGAVVFTTKLGTTLDFQSYTVTGSGTCASASGGTFKTASQYGFTTATSGGTGGSVQTTTRTYHASGNYTFNGSGTQGTGNFFGSTTPTANSAGTVVIDNTSNVTLDASVSANAVTMTNGHLILGNNDITAGSISGAGSGKHFKTTGTGQLKQPAGTLFPNILFPVGNTAYNPITLNNTGGFSDVYGVRVIDAVTSPAPNDATKLINRYWAITEGVAGTSTLTASPQYNGGEENANFAAGSALKLGLHNGTTWSEASASSTGSGPFVVTNSSAFTPSVTSYTLGIGKDDGFVAPTTAYSWNGSTSSSWTTTTNWTPNGSPTISDNVRIDSTGTFALDLVATTQSCLKLTLSGTGTFSISGAGTLTVADSLVVTSSAVPTFACSSTLNLAFTGIQSIPAWNYGSLNASGGARVLASSGTIGICGTYTPGSSTTITGSTINYNGTGAQSITAATYNNLTISQNRGGAAITLPSGTIDVAATFNPSASNFTVTTGTNTFNFSSAGAQNFPAFFYYNVTNTGNGPRTWSNSGVIDINNGFTPGTGVHTITGSSVKYSSTSATTFSLSTFTTNITTPARQYNNLEIAGGASTIWQQTAGFNLGVANNFIYSGSGTYRISGGATSNTMTVDGTFGQSGSGTFRISGSATNAVTGTLTVAGNATLSAGIFEVVGTAATTAHGALTTNDLTISGTGQLVLEVTAGTTGVATVTVNGNMSVTSSTTNAVNIGASTGIGNNQIALKGTFSKSGTGTLGVTGSATSTAGYTFSGTGTQTFSHSGTAMTSGNFTVASGSTVQLASSMTLGTSSALNVAGVLDADVYQVIATVGSSTFTLNATGTLKMNSATGVAGTLSSFATFPAFTSGGTFEFTGTNVNTGFSTFSNISATYTMNWTGSGSLTLDKNISLTNFNYTNSGLVYLGGFNMTISSTGGITGGSFSSSKMIVTNGAGTLIRTISSPLSASVPFTWPIGDTLGVDEYSPVTISATGFTNSIAGTIGFKVTDGVQSAMGAATSYLSRYWSYTTTGLSAYTWPNSTFTYAAADIVVGPEASLKANIYDPNNFSWTELSTSSAGSNVLTITAGPFFTSGANYNVITNVDITGRIDVPIYYQTVGTGPASWATPATWEASASPAFTSPFTPATPPSAANSALIKINTGHTVTVTTSTTADDLTINGTIDVSGATTVFTVSNGAAATDATISSTGTLLASTNSTSLTFATGASTAVNGLLKIVGTTSGSGASITNTGATINMNSGSTYEHARDGGTLTMGGTVNWNSGSTCKVTGITLNPPTAGSFGQTFANFTWQNAAQGATMGPTGNLTTVQGKLKVLNTNSNIFRLSNGVAYNLTVGDSLIIAAGTTDINSSTGTVVLTVNGHFLQSGGTFTKTGTATSTIHFNGDLKQTSGTFDLGPGSSSHTINLKGDLTNNGVITRSGATATFNFIKGSSGTQTWSQSGSVGSGAITWNIGNATTNTVQMLTDVNLGSSAHTVTVANGATIDFQDKILTGTNTTFTPGTTAILKIGSPFGITSTAPGASSGNLQVLTRTVNATSTYIYSGNVDQVTGNLLPSTLTTTGKISIANTGSTNKTVTLTTSGTTTPTLNLISGLFAAGSGQQLNITSGGSVSTSNGDFAVGSTAGVLNFPGSGSFTGTGNANPYNVYTSGAVNFGADTVTIQNNGTFRINNGGSVATNAPFYNSNSTLQYNINSLGIYGRGLEWSAASGRGYPGNVKVSNNNTLDPSNANANASVVLNCAGSLTIDAGSSFYMDYGGNNMQVNLNVLGSLNNSGNLSASGTSGKDIYVGRDWTANTGSTFNANTRAVFLNGSVAQFIGGTLSSTFPFLILNNSAGATLLISQTVGTTLTLTSGKLTLGNFDLNNNGTISGASSTNYIITNGSGRLKQTVAGSAVAFPVGNAAYNPITLTNTGTSDTYGVIETDAAAGSENDVTKIVTRNWDISEGTGGGSNLAIVAQWNAPVAQAGEEAANFIRGNTNKWIGNYTGSWSHSAATLSGSNPYTYSASGFTTVGKFEVGIDDAFRPIPLISSYSPTSGYTGDVVHIVGSNLSALTSVTLGGTAATLTTPTATSTDAYYLVTTGTTGNLVVTNAFGSTTAGTGFTYLGYITDNNTDWNVGATWRGGNVPPASAVTTIDSNPTLTGTVANNPASVTINSGKSLTFGGSGLITVNTSVTNAGTLVMTAGGTLTMAASGTFSNNNIFTAGTGTLVFAGAGTLNGSSASTLNNFTINGGATLTTVPTINGTLQINNGGFVTAAPNYASGSTLKYNIGAAYGRSTEWNALSGAGYPHHVQISNNTSLDVGNTTPSVARAMAGNLTVDSGSGFYMDFGSNDMTAAVTVAGDVIMNGGLSLSQNSGGDIVVGGSWTENSGSTFNANTRAVFLNGTGTQTITGNTTNTFPFLLLNKTAGSVALANNVTVSGVLTYQSSNVAPITTGSNTLIISSNSTTAIVRTGSGHVYGNLQRAIATGTNTYNFQIGDASLYAPVSIAANSVTVAGSMTASTASGDHAQIASSGLDNAKSVNRTWSISQTGLTLTNYSPTFTFNNAADLDGGANTANFVVGRYSGSVWTAPTIGTRTSTTTQVTGVTGYGDFAIAECKTPTTFTVSGSGTFCASASVSLSGSDTWVTYQLQLNGVDNGSPVTGTGSALSFTGLTTSGTYTVNAVNTLYTSCTATMASSAVVVITPTVTPSVTIGASPGTTICAGTSVTFTATPSFGGASPSYQWELNGANVGTNSPTYTNAALANGDSLSVIMTADPTVCPSPSNDRSNVIYVTVVSYVTPLVSIAASPSSTICGGDLVTFTATPTFGGGTPSYQWKLNGSNVGTNSNTYANSSLVNSDQVSCVLTSDYLCLITPTATSNTITMIVTAAPQVDAGTAMSTCGTSAYTFANGATVTNAASYSWTENGAGSITSGGTTATPTYTPLAGDLGNTVTFTLTAIGNSPCGNVTDIVTLVVNPLVLYYLDTDGDGFGNPLSSPVAACSPPVGRVADNTDCCDSNADINPLSEWWADIDGDGYGSFIYTTGCISGCSGPASTIPYYPPAHGGAPYAPDCNDNSITAHPGAVELCQNNADDNCNGLVDEGCSGIVNDNYTSAVTINTSNPNTYYPNCLVFNGTIVNAAISPEGNPANVSAGAGRDLWYRFTAPSTGAQIKVVPNGFNAVIELRTAPYPATQTDVENLNTGTTPSTGVEILNTNALTIGQVYYVGVRNFNNTNVGTFTLCVSPLMPSGCAYVEPVGGFALCANYKALYRGATSYTFNFIGVGGTAPLVTTTGTTSGLIPMSTASLALRYGGDYNVRVDANYAQLYNGLNVLDPTITINGNIATANCTGVTIIAQPDVEVKLSQRCPAVLTRNTYLIATPVPGGDNICSATSYTYRFTQVASCGGALTGIPFTVSTAGNTPYLSLLSAFPSALPNIGIWKVEVRPNFSYGSGTYGPAQYVQVNGSSLSGLAPEDNNMIGSEKMFMEGTAAAIYPNPGNGDMLNINMTNVVSDNVFVRITDAMGRLVYSNRYTVDGNLNTTIVFDQPLAGGLYMVEFIADGKSSVERMMIEK